MKQHINITKTLPKLLVERCKRNAKKRGFDFDIYPMDINIPIVCPYLNVPLKYEEKDKDDPFYYSIDRIDNSKGYVTGNVQIISRMANTMKNNASNEQLITFAKNVLEIHQTL
jgi:hypothetical protein